MFGDLNALSCLHVRHCGKDRRFGGIGFGRGCQKKCRVCEWDLRLGHSQFARRFTAGAHHGGGKRIGKPHVLGGDHLQAAASGEQLSHGKEFGKIKDCRIGI